MAMIIGELGGLLSVVPIVISWDTSTLKEP
jgi:hypothetical protein